MSCGCFQELPNAPQSKESKYFKDISSSFAIQTKSFPLHASFSWLVESKNKIPTSAYLEAEFKDPINKEEIWKVPMKMIWEGTENSKKRQRFYCLSPVIPGIECAIYDLQLKMYSDWTRTKVLAEHASQVLSRVSTTNCTPDEFFSIMDKLSGNEK